MIEQRIADLRNLPLLEDDPVYHLGRTLNTDEHIILDEILEDEIREIPGYQVWLQNILDFLFFFFIAFYIHRYILKKFCCINRQSCAFISY